jgi:hypothetical protein
MRNFKGQIIENSFLIGLQIAFAAIVIAAIIYLSFNSLNNQNSGQEISQVDVLSTNEIQIISIGSLDNPSSLIFYFVGENAIICNCQTIQELPLNSSGENYIMRVSANVYNSFKIDKTLSIPISYVTEISDSGKLTNVQILQKTIGNSEPNSLPFIILGVSGSLNAFTITNGIVTGINDANLTYATIGNNDYVGINVTNIFINAYKIQYYENTTLLYSCNNKFICEFVVPNSPTGFVKFTAVLTNGNSSYTSQAYQQIK